VVAPCITPVQYGLAPPFIGQVCHVTMLNARVKHVRRGSRLGIRVGTRSSQYEEDALDCDHKYETEHGFGPEYEYSNRSPEIRIRAACT